MTRGRKYRRDEQCAFDGYRSRLQRPFALALDLVLAHAAHVSRVDLKAAGTARMAVPLAAALAIPLAHFADLPPPSHHGVPITGMDETRCPIISATPSRTNVSTCLRQYGQRTSRAVPLT